MSAEMQKEPAQGKPQESAIGAVQERSSSKVKRKRRAKPGTKGEGEYFRINVRSKDEFTTFRYQDVGEKGHIQRLAGQRSNGSWDTQVWLISKEDAHIEGDALVADTEDARNLIDGLGSKPTQVEGDVFEAKDRPMCLKVKSQPKPNRQPGPKILKRRNKLSGHAWQRKSKRHAKI